MSAVWQRRHQQRQQSSTSRGDTFSDSHDGDALRVSIRGTPSWVNDSHQASHSRTTDWTTPVNTDDCDATKATNTPVTARRESTLTRHSHANTTGLAVIRLHNPARPLKQNLPLTFTACLAAPEGEAQLLHSVLQAFNLLRHPLSIMP
mmetsp:Transcript_8448/g.15912  ORF Transcript_8448/g.15912 Transcript_8448/m.15912 type:complete len:148 (+) Transcript_8448:131-574(+)